MFYSVDGRNGESVESYDLPPAALPALRRVLGCDPERLAALEKFASVAGPIVALFRDHGVVPGSDADKFVLAFDALVFTAPISEVQAELKVAGGDPDAIGKRGESLIAALDTSKEEGQSNGWR